MSVVAIIIGHNKWDEFTHTALTTLRAHNPDLPVVVVDHGSSPCYPKTPGVRIFRIDESTINVARNTGIQKSGSYDWYLLLHNDTITQGLLPLDNLDDKYIYGNGIVEKVYGEYISGCCLLISNRAFKEVGPFDPWYRNMDEVDWCYRALEKGFKIKQREFPMKHFGRGTVRDYTDYKELQIRSREYFIKKFDLSYSVEEIL